MAGEILVGVDGSGGSREALRWTAELASLTGRRLRAVRAWRYPPVAPMDFFATRPLESPRSVDVAIQEALREILTEELGEMGSAARVSAVRGDSAGALIAAARRVDAFLLALGARGLGGFRGLSLGSVARTVVEHTATPVAIVRTFVPLGRGAHLLVGADASPGSAAALSWAASLAADLHGEVHTVHAFHPHVQPGGATREQLRGEAERAMRDWTSPLREASVSYRTDVLEGDAREVLLEVAGRERPSLMVVASRARRLASILLGSVPTFLAQRLPGVLVVVPPPTKPTPGGGGASDIGSPEGTAPP